MLLTAVMYALLILVFRLVAWALRLKGSRSHVFQAALIFGNAGFIGIPIIMALWPHEGAIYVALMSIVDQTLLWTYGVWLCEPVPEPGTVASPDAAGRPTLGLRVRNLLGRFVNPAFIGIMLALVLIMLGVRIPSIVLTPLRTIGGMATPMSLITSNCRDGSWRLTVTARRASADTSSGKALTATSQRMKCSPTHRGRRSAAGAADHPRHDHDDHVGGRPADHDHHRHVHRPQEQHA